MGPSIEGTPVAKKRMREINYSLLAMLADTPGLGWQGVTSINHHVRRQKIAERQYLKRTNAISLWMRVIVDGEQS